MKKSIKRTAAVMLAVATTAGVAGVTTLPVGMNNNSQEVKNVAYAEETKNYLSISNYQKSVTLNSEFTLPTATFVATTGSSVAITNYTVTTPTGKTFTQAEVTDGKFKVDEIGTYTISYSHTDALNKVFVGDVTFVSSVSDYTITLEDSEDKILPTKLAVKNADGSAFTGEFKVPGYKVTDAEGEVVEDVIVETTLKTPSYASKAITDGKIVFNAENPIETGYYFVKYTVYKKNADGSKGEYLADVSTKFNAVSAENYNNKFDLVLKYEDAKPTSVNLGKTVELPAVTAKNGSEVVNSVYSVQVYKNGSTTPVAATDKVGNTDTLIITKNEDGKYEFTADQIGAYYTIKYTVKDALGNTKETSFVIDEVVDNIDPTPIVVDAYTVDELDSLKNADHSLKTIFGKDDEVVIKAIYAEDLGTFNYTDFKFERWIENSNREKIYTNNNFEDAKKNIVFNTTGKTSDDKNIYVASEGEGAVKLSDNKTYYVYYKVTDANNRSKSISYQFKIDTSFDWKNEEGTEDIAPTVTFNDTFYTNVDLGEKIEFSDITAKDDKDTRLETSVYYSYFDVNGDVVKVDEQDTTVLELNDNKKYVIDTENAPAGAAKVVIYAKAVNDGGKTTIEEQEIRLNSEIIGTSTPAVESVGYLTQTATQGDEITLPDVVFTDGTDGIESLNASATIKCTTAEGKVIDYSVRNAFAIRSGNYYTFTGGSFVAATAGDYQVAVKAEDAAGNIVIQFIEYKVSPASYSTELKFYNLGIADSELELSETLKLQAATTTDPDNDDYAYEVRCIQSPSSDYKLNKSEFTPNKVGEYKLQYVLFEVANPSNIIDTKEFTVTVKDTKAPTAYVNWNLDDVYDRGVSILLPKVSADDKSGIDFEKSKITINANSNGITTNKVIYLKDMNAEFDKGETGEMYFTFNRDSQYKITYTIFDKEGNKSEIVKNVVIGDTIAPELSVNDKIVKETYKVGDVITIDLADTLNYIKVSDNKTDVEKSDVKVTLSLEGKDVAKDKTSTDSKYTFTLASAGKYTLTFTVKDDAGYETKVTKEFEITTEAKQAMTKTEVIGTVLIVVSVAVLAGVVVYFIVSKKKMDKMYK